MYKPLKYVGEYHAATRRYPPYHFGSETWRHNPDRGDEKWDKMDPSYSQGQRSGFYCALPGPLCVGAYCDSYREQWVCPSTKDYFDNLVGLGRSLECSKVDNADGTWGWQCQ